MCGAATHSWRSCPRRRRGSSTSAASRARGGGTAPDCTSTSSAATSRWATWAPRSRTCAWRSVRTRRVCSCRWTCPATPCSLLLAACCLLLAPHSASLHIAFLCSTPPCSTLLHPYSAARARGRRHVTARCYPRTAARGAATRGRQGACACVRTRVTCTYTCTRCGGSCSTP